MTENSTENTAVEETYEADEIVELYSARWHAELDIRSLKTTLGMSDSN